MLIEIVDTILDKNTKVLCIQFFSIEEKRDQDHNQRSRSVEKSMTYQIDTTDEEAFDYITKWLHRQKVTKGCKTYGEAIKAVVGTVTQIRVSEEIGILTF